MNDQVGTRTVALMGAAFAFVEHARIGGDHLAQMAFARAQDHGAAVLLICA